LTEADWQLPLTDVGVDSTKLLELLSRLEDALEIGIENDDLTKEHMQSPASLACLLGSKLARRAPSRPRIAHVTPCYLPHVSGPQRLISELCRQLAEWFEFQVYSCDLSADLAPEETIDGVVVRRFRPPRATDFARLRRRVSALAPFSPRNLEQLANYDLPSSGLLRGIQASGARTLVTYFYYRLLSQELVDFFPSKRWVLLPSFFRAPGDPDPINDSWWNPDRADALVLFQHIDHEAALGSGIREEKLRLLPWPIDTELFSPTGEERERDTLLYVGRITARKGIRSFLPVFKGILARRPSLRWRIVGDVTSTVPAERDEVLKLRSAIAALGLAGRVELAGLKHGSDLVREYSRCWIHVLPSVTDCYSFATLEALACGMTCVNLDSRYYAWQRQLHAGQPLVHLCGSLSEMGDTILRLLEAGEPQDHRQYVVETHSWDRWRGAYRDVLLHKGARPGPGAD
jgi:glycosyltransferase involved in cell wall biosynthesis/acyl carrier protein